METQITLSNIDLLAILGKYYLNMLEDSMNTSSFFGSTTNTIQIYDLGIEYNSLDGYTTVFKIKHIKK